MHGSLNPRKRALLCKPSRCLRRTGQDYIAYELGTPNRINYYYWLVLGSSVEGRGADGDSSNRSVGPGILTYQRLCYGTLVVSVLCLLHLIYFFEAFSFNPGSSSINPSTSFSVLMASTLSYIVSLPSSYCFILDLIVPNPALVPNSSSVFLHRLDGYALLD